MSTPDRARRNPSRLDPGVAQRHAFGVSYERPNNLDASLSSYRQGKLLLSPQPVWTGDPTDWTADPFGDRNWRFQHHTLRWLNPLRWAALEGDTDARNEWLRVARSWAETNVPASKSKSDFAWKDMADGNRAIQLSLGVPLLGEDADWFVELLEYHRDWLMDEGHIVGKNHGLHQHQGLLVVGAALQDRDAVATAVDRMRAQFATTFDKQGVNDEGSAVYHQLNLRWWAQGWDRAKLEGIAPPGDARERFAKAAEVLAQIALPDGGMPQIGDSSRVAVKAGLAAPVTYVATGGKQGQAPTDRAVVFDGGYIISRSGWGKDRPLAEESHMLIRHGEELRAHSHRDRGSVHIYSAGQRWLVDSGFHSYQIGAPETQYLHSRDAHNVALLAGVDHDDDAPVELVHQRITDDAHDFTLLDHGYGDSRVCRRVIYLTGPDCWLVLDTADQMPGTLRQHWHLEPGVRVRHLDNGLRLLGRQSEMSMYWLGQGARIRHRGADDSSLKGWVGTKWKTLVPSIRVVAEAAAGTPRLACLISPQREEPLGIIGSFVTTTGNMSLHLVRHSARWRVGLQDGQLKVEDC